MINEKFDELGGRLFGGKVEDAEAALKALESQMSFSDTHRSLLVDVGGSIVFDNGAKFQTDEPSPLNDKDGYQNLEVLYGLGDDKSGLHVQRERYREQLPTHLVPIGEAPGGNLVCLDSSGVLYLWDHERPEGEGSYRIADSFDDFFARLEPDQTDIGSTDGIVESDSFLDF